MISGDFTERYDRGRLEFSVESEPGCVSWKGRPKLRRLQVSLIDFISCLRHLPLSYFRLLRPSQKCRALTMWMNLGVFPTLSAQND